MGELAEAATAVKAWGKPDPVKLDWRTGDDTRGSLFPSDIPAPRQGRPRWGWESRRVEARHRWAVDLRRHRIERVLVKNGVDASSVEGVTDMPYAIPNVHAELHTTKVGAPVLWWRSVGHTHTA